MTGGERIKLSVIIPVYNCERYVAACLDSILEQSGSNVEVICIDDRSQDESLRILKEYLIRDERVKLLENEENFGQGESRNRGLAKARGEYIWFVDADDRVLDGTISYLLQGIEEKQADIVLFNAIVLEEETGKHREWNCNEKDENFLEGKALYRQLIETGNDDVAEWRRWYSRSFLLDNEIDFLAAQYPHEDVLHAVIALLKANTVYVVPEACYEYRIRSMSSSRVKKNASRSVWALSDVAEKLLELSQNVNDSALREDLGLNVQIIMSMAARKLKKMDSLDRNVPAGLSRAGKGLRWGMAGVYNGYFPFLLSTEVMERIRTAKKRYIFGAGVVGQGLYQLLDERNVAIDGFVVTESTGTAKSPVTVCGKDSVKREEGILVMIALKSRSQQDSIREELLECGFIDGEIIIYDDLVR